MKTTLLFWIAFVSITLNTFKVQAQDSTKACRVLLKVLEGTYNGECKEGIANGKGEAKGTQSYTGIFKNGKPNGLGTYVYSDIVYYKGYFQDGLREGKGELHYLLQGKPDSIINGYWSADEYRGKKYTTYTYRSNFRFELTEFTPSKFSGHTLNIDIATNSGSPNGVATNLSGDPGVIIRLSNLISTSGVIIKATSQMASSFKSSYSYEIGSFPVKLLGTLSNGESFELELYKAADWKVRLFSNR